jgi:hypothetical protein
MVTTGTRLFVGTGSVEVCPELVLAMIVRKEAKDPVTTPIKRRVFIVEKPFFKDVCLSVLTDK